MNLFPAHVALLVEMLAAFLARLVSYTPLKVSLYFVVFISFGFGIAWCIGEFRDRSDHE
jgi:hypothetical protein